MLRRQPPTQAVDIVREPPVNRQPLAWIAGFLVAYLGWIVHRAFFVSCYWALVGLLDKTVALPSDFDLVYALVNLFFAFTQSFAVGLVVGLISRRSPYALASTALVFAVVIKCVHDAFDIWNHPRLPYEVPSVGIQMLLLYCFIPFLGAYIGQRLQRRYSRPPGSFR